MILLRHSKWIYAAAGTGVAFGMFTYLQSDKKCVQTLCAASGFESLLKSEPSVKWDLNWDRRDLSSMIKPAKNEDDPKEQNRINEEREKLKPTAARNIFLIRHGVYDENGKEDKDRKLTDLGKKQAECVGKLLKEIGVKYTNLVYSSKARAKETAEIIHKYLPDVPTESCDMLREGTPVNPVPNFWKDKEDKVIFVEGAQIEAGYRKYFHRADPKQKDESFEIIVCHGNVIRYFLCRALQIPPERWGLFAVHHCSITWIKIYPSGFVGVRQVGDYRFLPKELWSRIF